MKPILAFLVALNLSPVALAQERVAGPLQFPNAHVKDVLEFYQIATGKPVYVSLDLDARVTIDVKEPVSREAGIELIRKTLLEKYGIEISAADRGETLVRWSRDPKFPRRSDPPVSAPNSLLKNLANQRRRWSREKEMFERRAKRSEQQEMFVVRKEIAVPRVGGFYQKLEGTLKKCGFAEEVWKLCMPHYAEEKKGGRPGIDPVVYFKMQMVGFFENLPGQRAIAARCDDSRRFGSSSATT